LDKNIKPKILFEISRIDEIIGITKPLRDLCKIKTQWTGEVSGEVVIASEMAAVWQDQAAVTRARDCSGIA
jgi:hypothetical protein